MKSAIEVLWIRFRSLDVVRKKTLKSNECEIAYPTMNSMCPPPQKVKTKGGMKKKGNKLILYDVYRDPSYHDHVNQAYFDSQRSSKRPKLI